MPRSLAALLLALSLLSACTPQTGSGTTATSTTSGADTTSTPSTSTTAATTTSRPDEVRPVGIDDLPQQLQDDVVELMGLTEELRELEFTSPPVVSVVSAEELAERVRANIQEDVEDLPAEEALYVLLGLLEPEVDLLTLYLDLYGETVAGFYDGREGELVVPAGSDTLTTLERATLVHELTHALTDQSFEVWPRYERLLDEHRFDEASAFQAVIEGDAFLTEILYVQRLDPEERQQFLAESFQAQTPAIEQAPQFIQDLLVFPYLAGLEFVQRLHDLGGFEEVGEAYRSPPVSTEQIITPRDYERDEPVEVDLADLELAGYEHVYESAWGELGFEVMFDQVLGGRPEAVEGWGGDLSSFWFDGAEVAFALEYVGDAPEDAPQLGAALVEYASTAMAVEAVDTVEGTTVLTGDDYALVEVAGDRVVFLAASDPAVGPTLRAAFAGG